MENIIIELAIEVIAGVFMPIVVIGTCIIRYLWKKEKCFTLMKKTLDDLSKESSGSRNTHETLHHKINKLENRTSILETRMDLIITHFDIKPQDN